MTEEMTDIAAGLSRLKSSPPLQRQKTESPGPSCTNQSDPGPLFSGEQSGSCCLAAALFRFDCSRGGIENELAGFLDRCLATCSSRAKSSKRILLAADERLVKSNGTTREAV